MQSQMCIVCKAQVCRVLALILQSCKLQLRVSVLSVNVSVLMWMQLTAGYIA